MSQEFPGFHDLLGPVHARAHGCDVVSSDGRSFSDFSMGFGTQLFGHGTIFEMIAAALSADHLAFGLGDLHTSSVREKATAALCDWATSHWAPPAAAHKDQAANGNEAAPDALRALILTSGSEAVETALKTAMRATGRSRLVAFDGSYHGTFGLALAVTGWPRFRAPFAAHYVPTAVDFTPYGTLPKLDESVAGVIVEPVQGRAGIIVPPRGWLAALRASCDAVGALLIVDDIMVGCGRTTHAVPAADIHPDIVCFGKALGGGVPIGAVVAPARIAGAAWDVGDDEAIHTATFLGNPLSSIACSTTLQLLASSDYAKQHRDITAHMHRLRDTLGLTVRGDGALWAIDFDAPGAGVAIAQKLLADGVIVAPSGRTGSSITLYPMLGTPGDAWQALQQALQNAGSNATGG